MSVVLNVVVEALLALDVVVSEQAAALLLHSLSNGIEVVGAVWLVLHPVDSEALVLLLQTVAALVALVSGVRVPGTHGCAPDRGPEGTVLPARERRAHGDTVYSVPLHEVVWVPAPDATDVLVVLAAVIAEASAWNVRVERSMSWEETMWVHGVLSSVDDGGLRNDVVRVHGVVGSDNLLDLHLWFGLWVSERLCLLLFEDSVLKCQSVFVVAIKGVLPDLLEGLLDSQGIFFCFLSTDREC